MGIRSEKYGNKMRKNGNKISKKMGINGGKWE